MALNQAPLPVERLNPVNPEIGIHSANGKDSATFHEAARIQESFSARFEKRVLLWLAARLPLWVTSDQLTALGLASMCFASACYVLARWHRSGFLLAPFCLALNWFGDSLDGTLARFRNCQRPRYGFYVDHMIDSVGAVLLVGGLAASRCLNWKIAAGMLIAFLLLSIESYLATYTLRTFQLSFWKFGPTEIRILLSLGSVVLWLDPRASVFGSSYRLFDFGGLVAIAGMLAMLFAAAVPHIARLYREEAGSLHANPRQMASRSEEHVQKNKRQPYGCRAQ